MRRAGAWLCALLPLVASAGVTAADAADAERRATLVRGWAALRAMDCARCHGRDYGGWAAPSLVDAVRDGPRERFDRFVLEGDIARGMPGYKGQPAVVSELDAMYAYLRARAEGSLPPGTPPGATGAR